MSKSVVLYLHVHQPWRIRDDFSTFDVGFDKNYFREGGGLTRQSNGEIFRKVAQKSYLPMNNLLEKLLAAHPDFCFSLSITGTFLDQAEQFAPEVIASFQRLVATGRVEIVSETYYHSLAYFFDKDEFEQQVKAHQRKIKQVFGLEPAAFRGTELSYNDDLAIWAENFGFRAILAEGWDRNLGWRSANHVYRPPNTKNIKLLMKNYKLSDDLAFRFSNQNWQDFPLTSQKYINWLENSLIGGEIINLFMDYETFGEHQWKESGIFEFFEKFIDEWLEKPDRNFLTISQAAKLPARDQISVPQTTTWADSERDLTAWLGNRMQKQAMKLLFSLKDRVYAAGDKKLLEDWRRLTTSDHPYYMCTKYFSDGDVHAYFSPYKSPFDAFLYFIDALRDINFRLKDSPRDSFSSKISAKNRPSRNRTLRKKPARILRRQQLKTRRSSLKRRIKK